MVGEDKVFEALKAIRSLYPLERRLIQGDDDIDGNEGAVRPVAVGAH
jgi:flagellar protein FlbT